MLRPPRSLVGSVGPSAGLDGPPCNGANLCESPGNPFKRVALRIGDSLADPVTRSVWVLSDWAWEHFE